MARTACLVCFITTVNGRSKKRKKKPIMSCASSEHITKLKQSIFAFRYLWSQGLGLKKIEHRYKVHSLNFIEVCAASYS